MFSKLTGKKIGIIGYGTNNQKLADFFNKNELSFTIVHDWKSEAELIDQLTKFDIIFRTPGLPYLSKSIQKAKEAGVEISSQTKLFFELCPAPIIGVTGTKGKGTTTVLIAEMLSTGSKKASPQRQQPARSQARVAGGAVLRGGRVWVAGNIGQDPFEFLEQIQSDDLVVLELSSFQLQDLEQSPHIAVVLSISPDHLNHHKNLEEYLRAKSNIIAHQKQDDYAVIHKSLPEWFQKLGLGQKVFIDPNSASNYQTKLLGSHNWDNIAAAIEVAKIFKIADESIRKSVAEFQPLPHRLNVVAVKNGITYVDDSISTNEESTIAAIKTFTQSEILIVGGASKGHQYKVLANVIKTSPSVKAVIVIGEEASKITKQLEGFQGKLLTGAVNMKEIFDQIENVAVSGDLVLLSPGASSFDMFKDYKDRGEQFIKMVNGL